MNMDSWIKRSIQCGDLPASYPCCICQQHVPAKTLKAAYILHIRYEHVSYIDYNHQYYIYMYI